MDTGVRGSNAAIQSGSSFGRIDRPCVIDYVAFLHVGGFSKELNDVSGCSASPVDWCFHGPHFSYANCAARCLIGKEMRILSRAEFFREASGLQIIPFS